MIDCIRNAIHQWWLLWRGVVPYGWELILDIHNCYPSVFNRTQLSLFFKTLCEKIDMEAEDLHFWDYADDPEGYARAPANLKGTSAVQFIKTSTITIHTLDDLERVYLNVFSCKGFDPEIVKALALDWFGGRIVQVNFRPRW